MRYLKYFFVCLLPGVVMLGLISFFIYSILNPEATFSELLDYAIAGSHTFRFVRVVIILYTVLFTIGYYAIARAGKRSL